MLKNQRHERFAQGIAKGLPATRAYAEAGYTAEGRSLEVNASRLLRNAEVQDRIAELAENLKKAAIADADEIQQFLTLVMRGRDDDGDLTEDHVTKDGAVVPVRVSFRDRLKAAELLARARGVFTSTQPGAEGELEAIRRALMQPAPEPAGAVN